MLKDHNDFPAGKPRAPLFSAPALSHSGQEENGTGGLSGRKLMSLIN